MKTITLNKMPAPTWNRLRLNDITVKFPEKKGGASCGDSEITALGSELCGIIGSTEEISGNACINAELDGDTARGFLINADAGAELTVIMYIKADAPAALRTFAEIGEASRLRLVQVVEGGEEALILNDVGARVADSAHFDITQIFLGGKQTVTGVCTVLEGYRSETSCKAGYLLGGAEALDINNIILHKGKRSRSLTDVKGVLSGKAQKLFRGTIDFKNGASGSVGAETEDVLLMNEEVVNKTVPVILCAEEDVEGSHGASIGRLSDEVLYYMTSRGIPTETAYRLIAEARLEGLINGIGDERTAERAMNVLKGRWKNAEI